MEELQYQLVIQLPESSAQDYEELMRIEGLLIDCFEDGPHEVDGHDFGSGTMNIFIDTNDPSAAFTIAKGTINLTDHPLMKAAYRSFDEDDYTLIWPENSESVFDLI